MSVGGIWVVGLEVVAPAACGEEPVVAAAAAVETSEGEMSEAAVAAAATLYIAPQKYEIIKEEYNVSLVYDWNLRRLV